MTPGARDGRIDAAYAEARDRLNPGDGEAIHLVEGCGGSFRPMYGPGESPLGTPSSLVCPGCGAHRDLEAFAPDSPGDTEAR